ncbi:MAG: hypothetical protein U9N42_01950, partial [Campylobacterota bacterium]|nr:hypothetical protein [Campylobacterota bacterium]
PFLGGLFRSEEEYRDKVTTLVIITPYIVNQSADLQEIQKKVSDYKALTEKYASLMQVNYDEAFGKAYDQDKYLNRVYSDNMAKHNDVKTTPQQQKEDRANKQTTQEALTNPVLNPSN